MMHSCLCLIVVLVASLTVSVSGLARSTMRYSRWQAKAAILLGLTFTSPALAAPDCFLDCKKSCLKVAPGSKEYCVESCTDYCAQTDRTDGLSGSVDASGGETGIFGGSIDGTVTAGDDRPPSGIKLIPNAMLEKSTKKFKKSG